MLSSISKIPSAIIIILSAISFTIQKKYNITDKYCQPCYQHLVINITGKFAGLKKCRVGDCRIIYFIIGDTVLVLRISHRRKI
ncbi:MAG: type II toxin-antitoxin system RelE/ParE family toxin [Desulfobacterales bacterium]|nr:type II toxin-antitoxin system RelE/ParE family toxin [Desulfobacterales bacterium]